MYALMDGKEYWAGSHGKPQFGERKDALEFATVEAAEHEAEVRKLSNAIVVKLVDE